MYHMVPSVRLMYFNKLADTERFDLLVIKTEAILLKSVIPSGGNKLILLKK